MQHNAASTQTPTAVTVRIVSVNVGSIAPLAVGERTVMSGFRRTAQSGEVLVLPTGLAGDEHADTRVHGGPEKAVYAYPAEHYAFWHAQRREQGIAVDGETLAPGFLGENLTIEGLLEDQVWIGDDLHFPDCVLQVTQPRQPCFKFNAILGFNEAGRTLMRAGVSGFYLAVKTPGSVQAGQVATLVPGPRAQSVAQAQGEMAVKWRLKDPWAPATA